MSSSGKRTYQPDPKPMKARKDKKLTRALHVRGVVCVICGEPGSLHHVLGGKYGRDDVDANLVGLCGSGTTGCHGRYHGEDEQTRRDLGHHLAFNRPDTIAYIIDRLGEEAGKAWLARRLFLAL